MSKFVEYLFQYLVETAPRPVATEPAENKLENDLAYHGADEDYAEAVALGAARRAGQNPDLGV